MDIRVHRPTHTYLQDCFGKVSGSNCAIPR